MCGIAGLVGQIAIGVEGRRTLRGMTEALLHRGPDGEGTWSDDSGLISLGHRRLAVIDLSPNGQQPMTIEDESFALVFNGEIYNYVELRSELSKVGASFRGASDTEVLLRGLAHWGVVTTLKKIDGMFAFAFWDRSAGKVWIARDRFGEKPLYWTRIGGSIAFASELRSLLKIPGFSRELDKAALARFLRYSAYGGQDSVFADTKKVSPGSIIEIDLDHSSGTARIVSERRYFDPQLEAARASKVPYTGTLADATRDLNKVLGDSVQSRMISDVPLGAFLSGGIDSSLVVALMAARSSQRIKSFTIGFEQTAFNEAPFARRIAEHLGVDHHEEIMSASSLQAVVPLLPTIYDEPFADSSQIPTHLVSAVARQSVTVALSGDGGDELFGGYDRYQLSSKLWRLTRLMTGPGRSVVARSLRRVDAASLDVMLTRFGQMVPRLKSRSNLTDRLQRVERLLSESQFEEFYDSIIGCWDPKELDLGGVPAYDSTPPRNDLPVLDYMMLTDTLNYLPNDILTKVDRAAMGVSLETRIPLLSPEVYSFAWSLPTHYKVDRGQGKVVLRQLLGQYVPFELFERPKMGFGVPLADWLRTELREWSETLLRESFLRKNHLVNFKNVDKYWRQHLEGQKNWQHFLWPILMFEAWAAEYLS